MINLSPTDDTLTYDLVYPPPQPSSTPATVLTPATHPDVDTSQHSNLAPATSLQLCFTQPNNTYAPGPSSPGSVAFLSVSQMSYPAVNLLSSAYVNSTTCTNNTASVSFNSQQAYQLAVSNWTTPQPFVLVTYSPGCGTYYSDGQHGYILVTGISGTTAQPLTVNLNIVHMDFEQAVGPNNTVTVNVGSYSPTGNGTFSTTAGNSSSNGTMPGTNDFDQDLDDSLGPTISIGNSSFWSQILPNARLTQGDVSGGDDYPVLQDLKRSLCIMERRGLFDSVGSFFGGIGRTVSTDFSSGSQI